MQQKPRRSQGFYYVILISILKTFTYATLSEIRLYGAQRSRTLVLGLPNSNGGRGAHKFIKPIQLAEQHFGFDIITYTAIACWVSFTCFKHNTCKHQFQRIDIIGGCGPYNKAGRDNLVNKTKLILYLFINKIHVCIYKYKIFSKIAKIKVH